ncbi:uncharacterized protein LOC126838496 [Adelges cooleyi]|uniref:uncharacterized protein LOC126838496 n=1 Tax=Adelges cooleyi TaxID=133065 RepID=UPI00217F8AC3|nr:uncharacterized protein LOC126838496 [Adelges cooleyi]
MSNVDSKTKNRIASYKRVKNRGNNFRDILRERYRNLMKNKRETLLERVRNVSYDMRENEVTSFIDKTCIKMDIEEDDGFHSLDEEDQIIDEIKQELLDEEMKWISAQYSEYNVYLQHLQNDSIECPVCQTGSLIKSDTNNITCDVCHITIYTSLETDALKNNLETSAIEHSRNCQRPVYCSVFPAPDVNSMFMMCNECQFLYQIS